MTKNNGFSSHLSLTNNINQSLSKHFFLFVLSSSSGVIYFLWFSIKAPTPLLVITKQEIEILLFSIKNYSENGNKFTVNYSKFELE